MRGYVNGGWVCSRSVYFITHAHACIHIPSAESHRFSCQVFYNNIKIGIKSKSHWPSISVSILFIDVLFFTQKNLRRRRANSCTPSAFWLSPLTGSRIARFLISCTRLPIEDRVSDQACIEPRRRRAAPTGNESNRWEGKREIPIE